MLATCILHLLGGMIDFPLASTFLSLPHLPSLAKTEKTSLLCIFSKESISHSNQIWGVGGRGRHIGLPLWDCASGRAGLKEGETKTSGSGGSAHWGWTDSNQL